MAIDVEFDSQLAKGLRALESGLGKYIDLIDGEKYEASVISVWHWIASVISNQESVLDVQFILTISEKLRSELESTEKVTFIEGIFPNDWKTFSEEFEESDITNIECGGHSWILAQIIWGNHINPLACSIGWLLMNAYLLKYSFNPIYPESEKQEKIIESLSGATRETWDAENLRSIIG